MKNFLLASLLLVMAVGLAPVAPRAQGGSKYTASLRDDQVHDREIVLQLSKSATSRTASAVLSGAGVKQVSTLPLSYGQLQVVRVPAGQDYMATLHKLEADPNVVAAGPNVKKHVSSIGKNVSTLIPNDPRFLNGANNVTDGLTAPGVRDDQWGLLITGAQDAWDTTTGDPNVIVAVIDTGVNFNQEDMQGRFWTNTGETPNNGTDDDHNGFVDDYRGYDFYTYNGSSGGDPDPTDPTSDLISHGVATSSIIGARINNGLGMSGVAGGTNTSTGVKIMPLRVGTDNDIPVAAEIAAIDYAIKMHARVISMSFGGETGGTPEEDAINRAWNAGLLVFAAAGNEHAGNGGGDINSIDLPAGFDNCICVGATTIFDSYVTVNSSTAVIPETVAGYSKRGPQMDISAPGTLITAALNANSGYYNLHGSQFTGTSAATPIAAGLGALILSAHPNMTNAQALQLMKDTAVDLGTAGFDNEFGWGRIDMAAALPPPAAQGDYNGDGKINQADMAPIKAHFGQKTGDAGFDTQLDGNKDGVIDELDVFVIGRNFKP